MRESQPVLILSDLSDLVRLERAFLDGGRPPCAAVSIQIDQLEPNLALAAQKAINSGCADSGWFQAMAAAIVFGGLVAGCAAGPLGMTGAALSVTVAGAMAAGLFLGLTRGRLHARRGALRAVATLRRHLGASEGAPPQVCALARTLRASVIL